MNKTTLILGITAIFFLIAMGSVHAADGSSTEMNTQIMGYYAPYGLYVTAPLNQSVAMINNFSLVLRSPGESTYAITTNGHPYSQGTFSYMATIWFNTTWSGSYQVVVTLYSSVLAINQTFVYNLDMMSYAQYITYQSSHLTKPTGTYTLTQILEVITATAIGIASMLAIFERMWFREGVRARSKEGGVRTG